MGQGMKPRINRSQRLTQYTTGPQFRAAQSTLPSPVSAQGGVRNALPPQGNPMRDPRQGALGGAGGPGLGGPGGRLVGGGPAFDIGSVRRPGGTLTPPPPPRPTFGRAPDSAQTFRPGEVHTSYDAPRPYALGGLSAGVARPPDPLIPGGRDLAGMAQNAQEMADQYKLGLGKYDPMEEGRGGPFGSPPSGSSPAPLRHEAQSPYPAQQDQGDTYGYSRQGIEAAPVEDQQGQRVDPTTGEPIVYNQETGTWESAGPPPTGGAGHGRYNSPEESASNAPAGSSWAMDDPNFATEQEQRRGQYSGSGESAAIIAELQGYGYYIDAAGKIRDSSGGHHGNAGDIGSAAEALLPPEIQSAISRYREAHRGDAEAEAAAQRKRRLEEQLGMIPDAPQIDPREVEAMNAARRAMAGLESGQGLQAALSMAGRGRMGVGFQAGLTANQANQFSAQQAAMDAQAKWQATLQNFQAALVQYDEKLRVINAALSQETNQENADRLFQQQVALQRQRDATAIEMQRMAQEAEQEQGMWGSLLSTGGQLLGTGLGSLLGPPGAAVGGAVGGAAGRAAGRSVS